MYREVTMVEVKEVLRLWRAGLPKKRVAAQLGLAPRTVRRFVAAATAAGVRVDAGAVTDDEVRDTLLALQPLGGCPPGDGWAQCAAHRPTIERWLGDGLRLTKIQKLLTRQGVGITYPMLDAMLRRILGDPPEDGEPAFDRGVDGHQIAGFHGPQDALPGRCQRHEVQGIRVRRAAGLPHSRPAPDVVVSR